MSMGSVGTDMTGSRVVIRRHTDVLPIGGSAALEVGRLIHIQVISCTKRYKH
jgi:hypothetical protein